MKINKTGIVMIFIYYILTRAISDLVFNMASTDYLIILILGGIGGFLCNKLMFKTQ